MQQTRDAITQNLAERRCWAVARRDDTRVAWRLYRKQVVDGVYRLDEGALLVVFDQGFLDGTDLWWLDQQGIRFVVPAKTNMAVTADARAQAAAGEEITRACRVQTVRHGQGTTARTERIETEVVGITGLTTYDQYGPSAHGRQHNRRDFQPNPMNAVVVRKWHNRDDGPGGTTVFLTNASVQRPLQPFDDEYDRSLIENCCIKEAKQQWDLGHPPCRALCSPEYFLAAGWSVPSSTNSSPSSTRSISA